MTGIPNLIFVPFCLISNFIAKGVIWKRIACIFSATCAVSVHTYTQYVRRQIHKYNFPCFSRDRRSAVHDGHRIIYKLVSGPRIGPMLASKGLIRIICSILPFSITRQKEMKIHLHIAHKENRIWNRERGPEKNEMIPSAVVRSESVHAHVYIWRDYFIIWK